MRFYRARRRPRAVCTATLERRLRFRIDRIERLSAGRVAADRQALEQCLKPYVVTLRPKRYLSTAQMKLAASFVSPSPLYQALCG